MEGKGRGDLNHARKHGEDEFRPHLRAKYSCKHPGGRCEGNIIRKFMAVIQFASAVVHRVAPPFRNIVTIFACVARNNRHRGCFQEPYLLIVYYLRAAFCAALSSPSSRYGHLKITRNSLRFLRETPDGAVHKTIVTCRSALTYTATIPRARKFDTATEIYVGGNIEKHEIQGIVDAYLREWRGYNRWILNFTSAEWNFSARDRLRPLEVLFLSLSRAYLRDFYSSFTNHRAFLQKTGDKGM